MTLRGSSEMTAEGRCFASLYGYIIVSSPSGHAHGERD